ncbi:MAG: DUF294 nucleotidyltransferase-like domain-containing protein [Burkholderiaceae bacterium]
MPSHNTASPKLPQLSPSPSLLANLRRDLGRHPPFSLMSEEEQDFFLLRSQQLYFAPGEVVVEPASGPVKFVSFIRQGAVSSRHVVTQQDSGAFHYEVGDLFPLSAALTQRATTRFYVATEDTFILTLASDALAELAQKSLVFADFLNRRALQLLDLSRRSMQEAYASRTLAEQSLETRLSDLNARPPFSCRPDTPLQVALMQMQQEHLGSMLVTDANAQALGILTRHDILDRVTLPAISLSTPIREVMTQPVLTLTDQHTAQDALMLMSRTRIRHVPVTCEGRVIGLVSERDLFAMQRLSLKTVSDTIRAASDVPALKLAAHSIRQLARNLLGQGIHARQLTTLISHLNDVLTEQLLVLKAKQHGIDLRLLCWIALGAEGRNEQTIATDQDNAIILSDQCSEVERAKVLLFAHDVNLALDICGYPLCKGAIMAGNPACCLSLQQWRSRFSQWIEHGSPHDLLNASIYFDFRPLCGDLVLAQTLRQEVTQAVRQVPRFLKQLALNALTRTVPLNWTGGIDDKQGRIDLKLQGTAIFVDAARLYALAMGLPVTGTRDRMEQVGQGLGLAAAEYEAWASGFEFLQDLRLHIQLEGTPLNDQPNHIDLAKLNQIDRRILKETLVVARSLQQRLELDYER